MRRLMAAYGSRNGGRLRMPESGVWILAGCVLLARDVDGHPNGALMDIAVSGTPTVDRSTALKPTYSPTLGAVPMHGIFIRAPRIERIGPNVEALARTDDGTVVAARQGRLLVTTSIRATEDNRVHRYFLDALVAAAGEQVAAT